ncbi:hypothetical protein ScPMuIL_014370 [Solemya velum]
MTDGQISDAEKLRIAQDYKKCGNEYFKQKDHRQAIAKYHRALIYLKGRVFQQFSSLPVTKRKSRLQEIVEYCDNVLRVLPNNTKALYRKGLSQYHLKHYDKAQDTLYHAKDTEQGAKDPVIKKYIALCKKETVIQDEGMRKACQMMFNEDKTGKV